MIILSSFAFFETWYSFSRFSNQGYFFPNKFM